MESAFSDVATTMSASSSPLSSESRSPVLRCVLMRRLANLSKSSFFSDANAFSGTMYRTFLCFSTMVWSAGMYPMSDFPLAVGIAATRFLPLRAMGIACACGGWRTMNPTSFRASATLSDISSSSTLMPFASMEDVMYFYLGTFLRDIASLDIQRR